MQCGALSQALNFAILQNLIIFAEVKCEDYQLTT